MKYETVSEVTYIKYESINMKKLNLSVKLKLPFRVPYSVSKLNYFLSYYNRKGDS